MVDFGPLVFGEFISYYFVGIFHYTIPLFDVFALYGLFHLWIYYIWWGLTEGCNNKLLKIACKFVKNSTYNFMKSSSNKYIKKKNQGRLDKKNPVVMSEDNKQ